MKLINVYNMYMEKKLTPTLLAKTKGLEKCIVCCVICSGTGLVKKRQLQKPVDVFFLYFL